MTDETPLWERNKGKFDTPSSGVPKASQLSIVRADPAPETAEAYRGVEPIEAEVGDAAEIETVEGTEEPSSAPPSGGLSPDFLRRLVTEMEALADDRDEINRQLADLRKAGKDRGINLKALAALLKRRAMDSRMRDDFDECLAIYETVAGLTRGIIDRGELKSVALPVLTGTGGAKGRALQEALAWAGVGGSASLV